MILRSRLQFFRQDYSELLDEIWTCTLKDNQTKTSEFSRMKIQFSQNWTLPDSNSDKNLEEKGPN